MPYITYAPDRRGGLDDQITLKSLSIISFAILQVDLEHCEKSDQKREFCEVCEKGFRNLMGRCRVVDVYCLQYLTD